MKLTPQQEQLYAALSDLDEQYVAEALTSGKRSALPILYRVSAIAATIILIISAFCGINALKDNDLNSDQFTGFPLFSVGASSGVTDPFWEEMIKPHDPEYEPKPMFGDHPTFNFTVNLKGWRPEDGIIANKYTLTIYYNDTVVDEHTWNDEHIAYFVSLGENIPSAYNVLGWFDEPTDVTFSLIDKETNTVIQEQVVHIEYLEDQGKYEIEVTDFYYYV